MAQRTIATSKLSRDQAQFEGLIDQTARVMHKATMCIEEIRDTRPPSSEVRISKDEAMMLGPRLHTLGLALDLAVLFADAGMGPVQVRARLIESLRSDAQDLSLQLHIFADLTKPLEIAYTMPPTHKGVNPLAGLYHDTSAISSYLLSASIMIGEIPRALTDNFSKPVPVLPEMDVSGLTTMSIVDQIDLRTREWGYLGRALAGASTVLKEAATSMDLYCLKRKE